MISVLKRCSIQPREHYTEYDTAYVTVNELMVQTTKHGIITVKPPFLTDLASVPKMLRSFICPLNPSLFYPAIVHDWCYQTQTLSRQDSDLLFYDWIRQNGMSWTKANSMYYAIRSFGGGHYG